MTWSAAGRQTCLGCPSRRHVPLSNGTRGRSRTANRTPPGRRVIHRAAPTAVNDAAVDFDRRIGTASAGETMPTGIGKPAVLSPRPSSRFAMPHDSGAAIDTQTPSNPDSRFTLEVDRHEPSDHHPTTEFIGPSPEERMLRDVPRR